MYDIPTYNHSKPKEPSADRLSIFHIAARIALLGPILGGIFVRGVAYGFKDSHSAALILGLGGLTVIVNMACFGLGIFALCGIFRHGPHGILVRAIFGILLSGLSPGLFGAGFVHGFQTAWKQRQTMIARARSTSDQPGKNPDNGSDHSGDSPNTVNSPETAGRPDSRQSGNAGSSDASTGTPGAKTSKDLPADMGISAKALTIYQAKQQTLITTYDAAALAIKTPPVLSMKDLNQREQLIARKNLVNQFLDANEKWLGFSTKAEVNLRAEMVKLHADPATIDAGLKDYRQSAADRDFVQMQIRATDQRLGTATLNMLTILEANWGNWKYNAEKNTLSFSDSAVASQYNESFAEMNAAKTDQAQLQTELSRLSPPASPPAKPAL